MLFRDGGRGSVTKGRGRVDTRRDTQRTAETGGHSEAGGHSGGRFRAIAMIVIFDVAGPLVAYGQLRSAGLTTVSALLLSGVLPALGVTIGAIMNRRLDVVGVLVLAGIAIGTVLGLVSHNPKLVLMEGSVPTAVFGVACLVSLRARRPLMFSFALELTGPDTGKGRQMTTLWQYDEFRRLFRIITAVWGAGFLLEAALRVVIVENTSTGTALALSKASPFVTAGVLSAWTIAYGAYHKKKGERMGIVVAADGSVISSDRDLVPLSDGQQADEGGAQLG